MVRVRRRAVCITRSQIVTVLTKHGVPREEYHIGGYAECSVCIEKRGDLWLIYDGERGQKHDMRACRSMHEIVLCVCDKLGYDAPQIVAANPLMVSTARMAAMLIRPRTRIYRRIRGPQQNKLKQMEGQR